MKKLLITSFSLLALAATSSAATILSNGTGGGAYSAGSTWQGGDSPGNSSNWNVLLGDTVTMGSGDVIADNGLPQNHGTLTMYAGSSMTLNRYNYNAGDTTGAILNISGGTLTTNRLAGASAETFNITSGALNVVGGFGVNSSSTMSISGGTYSTNGNVQGTYHISGNGKIILTAATSAGDYSGLGTSGSTTWNGGTVVLNAGPGTGGNTYQNAWFPLQSWKTNDANVLQMSSGTSKVTTGVGTATNLSVSSSLGTMAFNIYSSTTNDSDQFKWDGTNNSLTLNSGVDISISGLSLGGLAGDYLGQSYQIFAANNYSLLTPTLAASVFTIGGTDYNVSWTNNLATNGSLTIAGLSAIPEPSRIVMMLGGMGTLLLLRRRRA